MKKIVKTSLHTLILAAVFATSQIYAGVPTTTVMPQPVPIAASSFDGFYVGISADVVSVQEKIVNDMSVIPTTFDAEADLHNNNAGNHNVGGSLLGGYGTTFDNQTYLGLEVFGHWYNSKIKVLDNFEFTDYSGPTPNLTQLTVDTNVKNPYSYGLAIRGGYLITPQTMFYILFGADWNRFEVKSTLSGLTDFANDFDKNCIGYTPGLGFETMINQNLSLRTQYAYTFYNSFKHTTEDIESWGTQTIMTKITPSRGMFSLMLSYYFG